MNVHKGYGYRIKSRVHWRLDKRMLELATFGLYGNGEWLNVSRPKFINTVSVRPGNTRVSRWYVLDSALAKALRRLSLVKCPKSQESNARRISSGRRSWSKRKRHLSPIVPTLSLKGVRSVNASNSNWAGDRRIKCYSVRQREVHYMGSPKK